MGDCLEGFASLRMSKSGSRIAPLQDTLKTREPIPPLFVDFASGSQKVSAK